MSASKRCRVCGGHGVVTRTNAWAPSGKEHVPCDCVQSSAFDALHAITHERDFVVRVNSPTINFARRTLAESIAIELLPPGPTSTCPACHAGYEPFALQPNNEDRE